MDKNVSGVDLEELMKAREELDKEKGIETDPNMYSDYNPDRKNEIQEESHIDLENSDYENITEQNAELPPIEEQIDNNFENTEVVSNDEVSETPINENSADDNSTIENSQSLTDSIDNQPESEEAPKDLSKYDVFAAFEVNNGATNSNSSEVEQNVQQPEKTDVETTADSLNNQNSVDIDSELSKAMESVDAILSGINSNSQSKEQQEESTEEENSAHSFEDFANSLDEISKIDSEAENSEDSNSNENLNIENSGSINIDVDAKFDSVLEETSESSNENEIDGEDEKLSDEPIQEEANEEQAEETNLQPVETEQKVEKEIDLSNLMGDIEFKSSEQEKLDDFDTLEDIPVEESVVENPIAEVASEPISKTVETKPVKLENEAYNSETEVITDYNQLKSILQKELEESEKAELEKVEEKPEVEEEKRPQYSPIEDFKFLNEIASDSFKTSHTFSYLMGKDEKGEMVYGNFKEHFNLAVFGKNEQVTNNFVNLVMLSLCLKNSYQDLNFVMLDADINSVFEIYNKSSYLFFNRIAKTNKEILDTLIEVTKEIDDRYEKLANLGVKNIEQYNQISKDNGFAVMPNIIVVFNNYTKSSQATDNDKINACLFQVLKFGRIVGVNALVVAKQPIKLNQINYSLSSRINFKYDDDSTYTLGSDGADQLFDDNDALFCDITSNEVKHIKTASISDTELDLIISDLEE